MGTMTAASEHMGLSTASFMFRSTARRYRIADRQRGQASWAPVNYLRITNSVFGFAQNFFGVLNGPTASSSLASGIHFNSSPSLFIPPRTTQEFWTLATSISGVLTGATANSIIVTAGVL